MSELSRLFVQQKYHINKEMLVGPRSTRIWITKNDDSIMIDFTESESLLLSVSDYKGWKNRLAAARKICDQFMKAGPICRYDAKPSFEQLHVMEWNILCPKERLFALVNHEEEALSMSIRNLQLLGDYCISDFKDAELSRIYAEAAEARRKYPGVYGKDPGVCDVARVSKADEFGLFLEYTMLVSNHLALTQYLGADGMVANLASVIVRQATLDELQMQGVALAVDYVAAIICRKLGFKIIKEPSSSYRLEIDENAFVKWYEHYSTCLNILCPEDALLAKVFNDYRAGKDVSAYAPAR